MSAIIYIHKGDSFYLHDIFKITRNSNPTQRMILLGDDENKKYATIFNLEFYNMNDFSIYDLNYKHYSVNTEPYEKFCYDRWIILNNFLKLTQIDIDNIIYSDSDNAFFIDINTIMNNNEIINYDVVYLGNRDIVCPNVLIAKKYVFEIISDGIIDFFNQDNNSIEEIVKTKKWYYKDGRIHFSDMFILKYILDHNVNSVKSNLIENNNNLTNFIFNGNYKNVKDTIFLKDKLPFINDKQVINLHFCGDSKKDIINYLHHIL